ncbi:TPA: hypothetical protein ACQ3VP_001520 [Clostridium perfringens]|nr:hypothetical protein [Clostridium perfringens]
MRELKLVKGEASFKVDVTTLVSASLDEEEVIKILGNIAFDKVIDGFYGEDIEIYEDDIKITLLDRECEEYQDGYLCESEIKELLEKSYERKDEIIEILPGQIGFNI